MPAVKIEQCGSISSDQYPFHLLTELRYRLLCDDIGTARITGLDASFWVLISISPLKSISFRSFTAILFSSKYLMVSAGVLMYSV
jgi:hypothetical protein